MIGVYALLWLAGIIASVIFIIKPNPRIALYATRGRAFGMLAAVFIGIPILASVTGAVPSTPDAPAKPATAGKPKAADGQLPGKSVTAGAPTAASVWEVSETKSPLDDSVNIYASVDSADKVQGWLTSERPTLTVRCKEGKLDAYIDTKSQITSSLDFDSGQSLAHVKYRVGSGQPVSIRAAESSDGNAFFFGKPEAFIHALRGADKFVVEYTPFQSGMGVATFDITGSTESLTRVLAACHKS